MPVPESPHGTVRTSTRRVQGTARISSNVAAVVTTHAVRDRLPAATNRRIPPIATRNGIGPTVLESGVPMTAAASPIGPRVANASVMTVLDWTQGRLSPRTGCTYNWLG
jgi:hypothetical protein